MKSPTRRPQIFISHSHLDSDFAFNIARDLSARLLHQGLDVDVITGQALVSGSSWVEYISDRILNCDAIVFVVSPNSLNSNWISFEVGLAISAQQQNGKPCIFPILWNNPDNVPTTIRHFSYINFGDEKYFEDNLRQLTLTTYKALTAPPKPREPEMAFDSKEGMAVGNKRNLDELWQMFLTTQRSNVEELRRQQEIVERRYYRDVLRRSITISLLILLGTELIVGAAAFAFYRSTPDAISGIKDLLQIVLTPTVGFVGAVCGFYFGRGSKTSGEGS